MHTHARTVLGVPDQHTAQAGELSLPILGAAQQVTLSVVKADKHQEQ